MKAARHAVELLLAALLVPVVRVRRALGWRPTGVTIVGWWGSETVGDVAILGQLLAECHSVAPDLAVTIVSFDPVLTRATLRELGREDVILRHTGLSSAWAIVGCRAQVVGGGPLMESPSMAAWAWRVRLARAAGARVLLYANGIGPVRSPRVERAIVRLLRGATQVVLRDAASARWCQQRAGREDVTPSFDPAFDFVRARRRDAVPRRPQLALALRTAPATYLGAANPAEAMERFIATVADALNAVTRSHDVQFVGIVMHRDFADSDDPSLYARLRARLTEPARLVVPEPQRIADVTRILQESRGALTVRFHAMIFALATDTPFVAIDYARPEGKVSAAAADVGRSGDVVAWDALDGASLANRVRALLDAPALPPPDLADAAARRRAQLGVALS